ncbi:MAG: restriction endonuclease, partial [Bacteroidales bacterium]|nr:restriction endonuclease [Bacteroidales bacterium]
PFTSDLPISSLKKVLELPIAKKVIIVSQKPSYFFNSSLRKRGDFLEIPPLSNQELDVLVGVLLDKGKKPDLTEFYNYFENNPRSILVALNSFNQLNFDTGSEFLDYLNKPIKQSGLIDVKGDPLDSGREETKIITQTIRVVNNSLIEKVNKKPGILFEISPRKFEELVAELLEKEGFNVNLTKQTRDGGKDIFVAQNNRLGNFLYYVECKQYSRDRPVGVNLVRELYGTISADRATAGLLITSSYFTKDAIEFTKNIQHQLSLKGYIDIKKWISEICLNTQ